MDQIRAGTAGKTPVVGKEKRRQSPNYGPCDLTSLCLKSLLPDLWFVYRITPKFDNQWTMLTLLKLNHFNVWQNSVLLFHGHISCFLFLSTFWSKFFNSNFKRNYDYFYVEIYFYTMWGSSFLLQIDFGDFLNCLFWNHCRFTL